MVVVVSCRLFSYSDVFPAARVAAAITNNLERRTAEASRQIQPQQRNILLKLICFFKRHVEKSDGPSI